MKKVFISSLVVLLCLMQPIEMLNFAIAEDVEISESGTESGSENVSEDSASNDSGDTNSEGNSLDNGDNGESELILDADTSENVDTDVSEDLNNDSDLDVDLNENIEHENNNSEDEDSNTDTEENLDTELENEITIGENENLSENDSETEQEQGVIEGIENEENIIDSLGNDENESDNQTENSENSYNNGGGGSSTEKANARIDEDSLESAESETTKEENEENIGGETQKVESEIIDKEPLEMVEESLKNILGEIFTGYNLTEISGSSTYNGVTVSVVAPIGSFPEGTILQIIPIDTEIEKAEIQKVLEGKDIDIGENQTNVSFNISFLDKDTGEELSPSNGKNVEVVFNYADNTDLINNENKEIVVYHMDDKVEEGEEIKVEEVEIISNEGGELKIQANSFSIYTILGVNVNSQYEGVIWNEDEGTITITDGTTSITMADKNIGATEVGYGSRASTGSYGLYYQMGGTTGYAYSMSASEAKAAGFDTNSSTRETDTSSITSWSQELCPNGYHIPTSTEWNSVLSILDTNGISGASDKAAALKIPFAGYRSYDTANMSYTGSDAYVRSVSPYSNKRAYYLFMKFSEAYVYHAYRGHAFSVRCFKDTQTYTVMFDSNGGTEVESIEAEEYTKITQPTNPTKTGYVFSGWYVLGTDILWNFETEIVTGDTTLYTQWNESRCANQGIQYSGVVWNCEEGTITVANGNNSITMKDMNVGATKVGYGASASVASYGNYYQWGGMTGYSYNMSAAQAIASGFNTNNTTYSASTTFWTVEQQTQICGEGYHIPTIEEWNMLISLFTGNGNVISTFNEAFKIPFAGVRDATQAHLHDKGNRGLIWLNSIAGNTAAYNFYTNGVSIGDSRRSAALSIRCLKDAESSTGEDEGYLSILAPTVMNTNSIIYSKSYTQSVILSGGYFRISDYIGSNSGWYTTLSITNLSGTKGGYIDKSNIYIKSNGVETLSGTVNDRVVLNDSLSNYVSLSTSVKYISRAAGENNNKKGIYGTNPELKVEVPGYQVNDTYNGTLVFTIYEN